MRRWTLRLIYALLLTPPLLVAALFAVLNTTQGQDLAATQITALTSGMVKLEGLRGRFPDRLTLDHVEIHDTTGPWLTADNITLDWSPTALLHKQALIHTLTATTLNLPRLANPTPPAPPSTPFQLPLRITVETLAIPTINLGTPIAGTPTTLGATGKADLPSLQSGTATLAIASGQARYTLIAALQDERIDAALEITEPAQGLIARLAGLPDLGPIHLTAATTGPRTALATKLDLTAGPLTANATALIDSIANRATIDATATAPAMTPAPGISWRAIALDAHIAGPFTAPDATGHLRVENIELPGTALRTLTATLAGNAGRATIKATLEGLRIPGPDPALLESAPIQLQADARLDDPARPVTFTLSHPILDAQGTARTAGDLIADVTLRLPDFTPLGKLAALDLAGHSALTLHVAQQEQTTSLDVAGTLTLDKGPAPAPILLGPDAKLALSATLSGPDITLRRLSLDAAKIRLEASGTSKPAGLDITTKTTLDDLSTLAPTLTGTATLDAHITGPPNALAADATLTGDIGAPNIPRAPIRIAANLKGLPGAPTGHITADGTFAGAPVQLALNAAQSPDGALHATIEKADWRSLHAEGALTLAPPAFARATLPQGRIALRITRLDDLRPFIGQPLSGSLEATAQLDATTATIDLQARNAGIPGSRVATATLKARITDPIGTPAIAATLTAEGIAAAGFTGNARIEATGPQSALALKATTTLSGSGTEAKLATSALLDLPAKQIRLNTLDLTANTPTIKPETIRLLAPATIRFANIIAVDRLRLGVRTAILEVAGTLSPRLQATATLRMPADIAAAFAPDYAADGTIALDAQLSGTPAAPSGTIKLNATGLRLRTGPGRAMPPATLTATATLAGAKAQLDARLTAGNANLAINGTAPVGQGPLNLRATGALDLALLDPLLNAAGRRARGRLALDATITGATSAPILAGNAQLSAGEIQDFSQGVRINALTGTVRLQGQSARLDLTGRAGPGTVAIAGTIGALDPTLPLDLAITLRNARPLASDLVTADIDGDITLKGPATSALQATGKILVRRAELQIPRTLPASIVTLNVRRPNDKPPTATTPAAPIALDLTIDAPSAVYLRGRGVDAEMAGTLRIRGTSTAPRVSGGLQMRRGNISVAGTTLSFSRGKVGFDGTGVSGRIDPTLDFAADSTAGGVTATLAIGGYVSKPKITLSSIPGLPQDEVLAYLIFKRSAKELGPFQIASIAAALAELTGIGGDGGLNPLESVRKGLGLDRLSVGAGSGTRTTPTIEAGRYIANGVYVGAKQGTTGGQTQATVQIDITKGLKLQTDVGTGQGGNAVGLTYQFEY